MLSLMKKFLIVLRTKCSRAKLNIVPVALTACLLCACDSSNNTELSNLFRSLAENAPPPSHEWHHFLGDAASRQYSPLDQITSDNVHTLHEAWRYDPGFATAHDTEIPTNPLIIKGVLYGLNARKDLFALNAATGEELWVHTVEHARAGKRTGRGLVYWEGVDDSGQVARWIILGLGHELIAVNA